MPYEKNDKHGAKQKVADHGFIILSILFRLVCFRIEINAVLECLPSPAFLVARNDLDHEILKT